MVVLDELPTASLMDGRGRIDAARYPGFAAFARRRHLVPQRRLRGRLHPARRAGDRSPARIRARGPLQVAAEYPDNLFTLLGGAIGSNVFEALTDICRAACERQLREPFGPADARMVSSTVERVPALPPSISPPAVGGDLG